MPEKIVLAYSGGLDTSVAIRWLKEERGYDVVALTVDVGMDRSREELQSRAMAAGAVDYVWRDAQETFIRHFAFPALMAGARYQGHYPLATALSRPLIAREMVGVAKAEGATAVAHGCTGKGNDQVRLDVSVQALAPDLKIVAPLREWEMDRESEIAYAEEHNDPDQRHEDEPVQHRREPLGPQHRDGRRSKTRGSSRPTDVYAWTKSPDEAPDEPAYVEIGFESGLPVSLDGKAVEPVALVKRLNALAGEHGVGRIDSVEDRLVGIKSREIYEAPAGDHAARGARGARVADAIEGAAPAEDAHRPGVRGPRLQRALVLRPPPGPRGVHRIHAAPRQRRRPGQAAQGDGRGGRAEITEEPIRLLARHLRQRRQVRPQRRRGVHQHLGTPGASAVPSANARRRRHSS